MKKLLALSLLLAPATYASPLSALFGTQNVTPNTFHTVTGPLIQLQTSGGTTLSFQQGARFMVDDTGTVTLTSGNLRVGPAGNTLLQVQLPQGPITIAPLTAATITAQPAQTSGKIYQGNLVADNRTFTTGEGFVLTQSGAHGTFTPAPAQAPALSNLSTIEPAAGPSNASTPPAASTQPTLIANTQIALNQAPSQAPTIPTSPVVENPPATEQPVTQQPINTPPTTEEPVTELPVTEQPVTEPPVTEQPPVTEPEPDQPPATEEPPVTTPEPTPPAEPEQPVVTEPDPVPVTTPEPPAQEAPTTQLHNNLYAAWSTDLGVPMPTNYLYAPGDFSLSSTSGGPQSLEATQTRDFTTIVTLQRGTAENLDATSHGITSGLGRWVGGQLVAVTNTPNTETTSLIDNTTATNTNLASPNSLHYIWGEKPTAIPTSGHVEYTLVAATQPTYVTQPGAAALSSAGATFAGNLAIDFAPGYSGIVGAYHLNGTVTMPQVTQTETGPTTNPVIYNLSTAASGVPLSGKNFANTGSLIITAPSDALACPGTCTGTVNAAGFGAGMKDAGTLYAINPTGPVAVTGAAIFTATP